MKEKSRVSNNSVTEQPDKVFVWLVLLETPQKLI